MGSSRSRRRAPPPDKDAEDKDNLEVQEELRNTQEISVVPATISRIQLTLVKDASMENPQGPKNGEAITADPSASCPSQVATTGECSTRPSHYDPPSGSAHVNYLPTTIGVRAQRFDLDKKSAAVFKLKCWQLPPRKRLCYRTLFVPNMNGTMIPAHHLSAIPNLTPANPRPPPNSPISLAFSPHTPSATLEPLPNAKHDAPPSRHINSKKRPGYDETDSAWKRGAAVRAKRLSVAKTPDELLGTELEMIQRNAEKRMKTRMNQRGLGKLSTWLRDATGRTRAIARRGANVLAIQGDLSWVSDDAVRKSLSSMTNEHLRLLEALFDRIETCSGGANWDRIVPDEEGIKTRSGVGEQ